MKISNCSAFKLQLFRISNKIYKASKRQQIQNQNGEVSNDKFPSNLK